jgi:hypothetical protein
MISPSVRSQFNPSDGDTPHSGGVWTDIHDRLANFDKQRIEDLNRAIKRKDMRPLPFSKRSNDRKR